MNIHRVELYHCHRCGTGYRLEDQAQTCCVVDLSYAWACGRDDCPAPDRAHDTRAEAERCGQEVVA